MSDQIGKDPGEIINGLSEEDKQALLEHLADELGFGLMEPGEEVDPQLDIVDVMADAIRTLQENLAVLQAQFAEGAELEYSELERAAEGIEVVVGDLTDVHGNINTVIDLEFDLGEDGEEEND